MNILLWSQLTPDERAHALRRPPVTRSGQVDAEVRAIIERVRAGGERALIEITEQFDGVRLAELRVSPAQFEQAAAALTPSQHQALAQAHQRIQRYHLPQVRQADQIETAPGVLCERVWRPIQSVGLYVPAGSAPLPSTVLMLGVPSALAQCPVRVLCAPPRRDGTIDPAILSAARLCGITDVFRLGGAQAIAAMAYGSESVPKTDKIFGPGNAWVTAAKAQVAQDHEGAAADMPAGPSEVMVIADAGANAEFVAADLLSQAEHGPDSQVVLVSTDTALARRVQQAIDQQLQQLTRATIARQALEHARLILVNTLDEATQLSNQYAPEHLIIQTAQPRALLPDITNAGSVFLGPWSPEAIGDYCSGTNHVLPTYGHARSYSGLSVDAFVRSMSVQECQPNGLDTIGPTGVTLAQLEGLDAHANAIELRLAQIAQGACT